MAHNPYETLGVSNTASIDEIKEQFRKLALIFHPDKSKSHNSETRFKVISGMPNYFAAMFYDFKDIAITQAIINDYSNGMIQHFHTVFFVEGLEVIGIFIFSAIVFGKQKEGVLI